MACWLRLPDSGLLGLALGPMNVGRKRLHVPAHANDPKDEPMQFRSLAAVATLVVCSAAFAQPVPISGTYKSSDGNYTFRIVSANSSNGVITGEYAAAYSPAGPFSQTGEIGHYAWVFNSAQGTAGVAPFTLSFEGTKRPDNWDYSVVDRWTGAYLANNTIIAQGSRSFVRKDGLVDAGSLGTFVFTKR